MRRALTLAFGLCLLTGSVSARHAAVPTLTGTWVFDTAATSASIAGDKMSGAPIFGDLFFAEQTAATLTLRIAAGPLRVTAIYALDGSASKNMSPGNPPIEVTSRSHWDGDRLVIVSHSESPGPSGPVPVDSTRTIFLDAKGHMVIERTGTPAEMVPASRGVYRKQ